jgi:WD40 repeat protein
MRVVAFSPDGKGLVMGSSEGFVRLWDIATGQELMALKGHSDGVHSVAFSPDGETLVSGSVDGTIRVWRAASMEEITAWEKTSGGKP